MTLRVWDPIRDVTSLHSAMDRLFQDAWVRPNSWVTGYGFGLPVDLVETPDEYIVKAALPGFHPDDVNLSVTGDTLTIQAEFKDQHEPENANYLLRERRMGNITRSFTLPVQVDADKAQARYENGELILTLPKAEEVKPRQIQISMGTNQAELVSSNPQQNS